MLGEFTAGGLAFVSRTATQGPPTIGCASLMLIVYDHDKYIDLSFPPQCAIAHFKKLWNILIVLDFEYDGRPWISRHHLVIRIVVCWWGWAQNT
jgi:hypothetical protein